MRLMQRINEAMVEARFAGTFTDQVQAFVAEARELAADGLTLSELGHLFLALITLAVDGARQLAVPGAAKKQWVLSAVAQLYDAIARRVPLPWFLEFFRPVLRPHLRALVLAIADGVIEAVYATGKSWQFSFDTRGEIVNVAPVDVVQPVPKVRAGPPPTPPKPPNPTAVG